MGQWLEGKTVVLGLTGGIACYKAAELVRVLTRNGATVRVMMSAGAQQFITPLTLQTLSGHPVATNTFDLTQESDIGHIRLADSADVLVIAPATANVIGKLAAGIADDLITTVALATRAPIVLAPAMNVHMYENPIVQANLEPLADVRIPHRRAERGVLGVRLRGQGTPAGHRNPASGDRARPQPTGSAGRTGPDHRRSEPRAARPGPLHLQSLHRQDGLRLGGRGVAPRRPGEPDCRPVRASDPARRAAPRRRAQRRRCARPSAPRSNPRRSS